MKGSNEVLRSSLSTTINYQLLIFIFRLLIGSIFISAAFFKLTQQTEFIQVVYSYGLLPFGLSRLYGVLLPWVELLLGCLLITGTFIRFASSLSIAVIISFLIANIYALSTGTAAATELCGCFGSIVPLTHTGSLILNIFMLPVAVLLTFGKSGTLKRVPSKGRLSRSLMKLVVSRQVRLAVLIVVLLVSSVVASTIFKGNQADTSVLETALLDPGNLEIPLTAKSDRDLANGMPVLVYFYSDECHYCQQEKPIIDELETTYGDRVSFVRIDTLLNSEMADNFDVTALPSIFLIQGLTSDDQYKYQRFRGLTDKETLSQHLDTSLYTMSLGQNTTGETVSTGELHGDLLKAVFLSSSQSLRIGELSISTEQPIRTPESLEEVWKWAREAGNYRFSAELEQTMKPRPIPSMIGETSQKVDMLVEGKVLLPDSTELQLGIEANGLETQSLRLIQSGQDTFVDMYGNLERIDNPLSGAMPLNDYLGTGFQW
jgi:putative oxidoreductase